ncbi:RNA-guided endonuclease InsQ/TnpB family protein [Archaeoglobus sp.]
MSVPIVDGSLSIHLRLKELGTFISKKRQRIRSEIKTGKRRRELLQKYGKREKNRVKDILHKVSKTIVEFAKVRGCGIILEDLKGIRKSINFNRIMNRRLHNWSFRKLQSYIEYKAKLNGIPVVYVNPKGSSSHCPICGGKLSPNGQWREKKCVKCGVIWNRDFVACLNLLKMWGTRVTPERLPMNLRWEFNHSKSKT